MCFLLQATLNDIPTASLDDYCGVVPETGGRMKWIRTAPDTKLLELSDPTVACSCSFVVDPTTSSTQWELEGDYIPLLAEAVDYLFRQSPRGICLTAVYFGDEVRDSQRTTLRNVLQQIRSGRLDRGIRLVIAKRSTGR